MNCSSNALPAGFETLEPFVSQWAVEGANNRLLARLDSTEEERTGFFNAARDLIPGALELLDKKPLAEHDESEKRLMLLVLSIAHVSQAVEIQRDDEPYHAKYARFITITQASAETNPAI